MTTPSVDNELYLDGSSLFICDRSTGSSQKSMRRKVPTKRKRSENDSSLATLTQHFMRLLMNSPGWQVEMNQAAESLNALSSKRRLYDITGVLLGAGLVTKPLKNIVAWTGFDTVEEYHRTTEEIAALLDTEKLIDRDLEYMRGMIEKLSTFDEAYLTKDDIASLCKDKTLMFVRGPPNSELLVPTASDVCMFSLKSPTAPIDVFLFSDAEDETATETTCFECSKVEEFNTKRARSSYTKAVKKVCNIKRDKFSFSDCASVLLRGLYPGPFRENELSPRKMEKHAVNFIPLELVQNQNRPPIASYRAESAAYRAASRTLIKKS